MIKDLEKCEVALKDSIEDTNNSQKQLRNAINTAFKKLKDLFKIGLEKIITTAMLCDQQDQVVN